MSVALAAAPTKLSAEFKKALIAPLRAGEKAVYELINYSRPEVAFDKNSRPLAARAEMVNSVRIPNDFPVNDPYANEGEGQEVMLAYTKGTRTESVAGGGVAIIPDVQDVWFKGASGGRIIVDSTQRSFYEMMECNPANADTVASNGIGSPLFRRVRPEKTAEKQVNFDARVTEARNTVHNASTADRQFMAVVLGLPTDLDSTDKDATDYGLTALLNSVANQQPDAILTANRSDTAKAMQLVRDLDATQQARFDPEKGMWMMTSGEPLGGAIQSAGNASQELAKWFQFSPQGIATAETLRAAVKTIKDKDAKRNK